jgi:D-sedoheptulose 7-phosphate isomerase
MATMAEQSALANDSTSNGQHVFEREQYVIRYVEQVRSMLKSMEPEIRLKVPAMAALLDQARLAGKHVYVMGNGGSGAAASHFANDLNKYTITPGERRYKCVALTDNMPYILAVGNDIGYDDIFVEQLKNYAEPGDVLIGISGSGNSANCVRAIEFAKTRSVKVVSWTGYGGGKMAAIADLALVIPSHNMTQCEDSHVIIHHCLVSLLKAELDAKTKSDSQTYRLPR